MSTSLSCSSNGELAAPSLSMELDEIDDRREGSPLSTVDGCGFRLWALAASINSQEEVLCKVPGGENGCIEAYLGRLGGSCGAEVGWRSGDEALVVPDQNDGTGLASGSVMEMDGTLPAEKGPISISLPVLYGVG